MQAKKGPIAEFLGVIRVWQWDHGETRRVSALFALTLSSHLVLLWTGSMVHAAKLGHSESEDWPRSAWQASEACAAKTWIVHNSAMTCDAVRWKYENAMPCDNCYCSLWAEGAAAGWEAPFCGHLFQLLLWALCVYCSDPRCVLRWSCILERLARCWQHMLQWQFLKDTEGFIDVHCIYMTGAYWRHKDQPCYWGPRCAMMPLVCHTKCNLILFQWCHC